VSGASGTSGRGAIRARRRHGPHPVSERAPGVQEDELATGEPAAPAAARRRGLERLDADDDAEARGDAHQLVEELPAIHAHSLRRRTMAPCLP
jgi:hypothetical protein